MNAKTQCDGKKARIRASNMPTGHALKRAKPSQRRPLHYYCAVLLNIIIHNIASA
ncbi:hypothetical protein KIN20_024700 [Parelaphostrongylus tenuis]|uniref:Uncharacterized protein n=1 Tax=Parelaphostrongylus tenuis TaxID=148309 RepID=A0AAD5MYL7_PARTN|nr:hypothetical protein KIN20_024700 [Parelaphostrongylus tenuis]